MYDCFAWDEPIFPANMGASYLLRTKQLLVLFYCIVVTLNVDRQRDAKFQLYSLDIERLEDAFPLCACDAVRDNFLLNK